jgi:hypothetical protein
MPVTPLPRSQRGMAGWLLGPRAILWLVAALAATSILAVLAIKSRWVDHDLARGSDKAMDRDAGNW